MQKTEIINLVQASKNRKKKKPKFIRHSAHKKKCLKRAWRRPRGLHNKLRLEKRGHEKKPAVGWSTPKPAWSRDEEGRLIISIKNLSDLENATKENSLLLSSKFGKKKKLILLNKIKEKGLTVLNLNVDETLKKLNFEIELKKKLKEVKKEKKKEKQKEEKPASIEETIKKEELTDEEKKKKDKEEKDKILTKRT